jgi:hypothetical protein
MRKRLLGPLFLLLLVPINTAWADGPVIISRLGDLLPGTFDLPTIPVSDCIMGNYQFTNLQLVEHIFLGEYLWSFAAENACDFPGFRIWNVHFLIGVWDPVAFDISVRWYTAMFNHADPYNPLLGLIRESQTLNASFPESGVYQVSFPVEGDECAYPGYAYVFSVSIPDIVTAALGVCSLNVTFGGCSNRSGFEDCPHPGPCFLVEDYGWPGDMVIWADAAFCSPPVRTDQHTWGIIKTLYR